MVAETAKDVASGSPPTLDTILFNKFTCPAKLTGEPTTPALYDLGTAGT